MFTLPQHIIHHAILGVSSGGGGGGTVTGTGTTNFVTKWTNGAGGVLGDSLLSDDGTNVGIVDSVSGFTALLDTSQLTASGTYYFTDPHPSGGNIITGFGANDQLAVFGEPLLGAGMVVSGYTAFTLDRSTSQINIGDGFIGSPGLFLWGQSAKTASISLLAGGSAGIVQFAAPTAGGRYTFSGNTSTYLATFAGGIDATNFHRVAITEPLTGATLTIADGKTLTQSNTLTYTGTDGSSVNFGTGGTVSYATSANPTASVGLSAVNGSASTFMRSDGAPPLDVGIVPTWTGIHTFSARDVHNAGLSLGTNGELVSAVADAASAVAMKYKPGVALTSSGSRLLHSMQDSAGNVYFDIASDGSIAFSPGATVSHITGILFAVGSSTTTIDAGMSYGIKFGPTWGATTGTTIQGISGCTASAYFAASDNASATATTLIGGVFTNQSVKARAHTAIVGGLFYPYESTIGAGAFAHGNLYGWWVKGVSTAMSGTATNSYGGYIENTLTGATPTTTNQYGLVIEEQTRGGTIKNGLALISATAGYKAIAVGDQGTWIAWEAANTGSLNGTTWAMKCDVDHSAKNILTDGTTGTKIGTATTQKLSLWNAATIVQPTNAIAAATFVANTSAIVDDSATFDGYTIGQVVKALRNFGALA